MVGRIGKKEKELNERIAELEAQLKEVIEAKYAAAKDSNVVVQNLEAALEDEKVDRDICAMQHNALVPESNFLGGDEQTEMLGIMAALALIRPVRETEIGEGSLYERAAPFALQTLGNCAGKNLEAWLDGFEDAEERKAQLIARMEKMKRDHSMRVVKRVVHRMFEDETSDDTSED